jgi:hypothetical protein
MGIEHRGHNGEGAEAALGIESTGAVSGGLADGAVPSRSSIAPGE